MIPQKRQNSSYSAAQNTLRMDLFFTEKEERGRKEGRKDDPLRERILIVINNADNFQRNGI